jgi:hypothetical protein
MSKLRDCSLVSLDSSPINIRHFDNNSLSILGEGILFNRPLAKKGLIPPTPLIQGRAVSF